MKRQEMRRGAFWGDVLLGILCVILGLVLAAMIFVTVYADHLLGKINYVPEGSDYTYSDEDMETLETEEPDPTEDLWEETVPADGTVPTLPPEIPEEPFKPAEVLIQHKDIVNILLIGQDRRPGEGRRHSDSMIVCTINTKTSEITLTSFMRDMYVQISGWKKAKINLAYIKGGMPLLKQTLKENFGMVIDGCVEVDFDGFQKVIDLVGGVDIELDKREVDHLNGIYYFGLVEGMNHLNGEQALAYSRVRRIGSDYERTYRQRKVLRSILESSRDMSLVKALALLEEALPMLTTDMTPNEISRYAVDLFPHLAKAQIKLLRIPANGQYLSTKLDGVGSVLIPDLEAAQKLLQDKLLPQT